MNIIKKILIYPLIMGMMIYAAFQTRMNLNTTEVNKGDNIGFVCVSLILLVIGLYFR